MSYRLGRFDGDAGNSSTTARGSGGFQPDSRRGFGGGCRSKNSKDETGQLLAVMQNMSVELRWIVGEVGDATARVDSAAAEIAQGSADSAQRTEEQASALEKTLPRMEKLTSTVKQSAPEEEAKGCSGVKCVQPSALPTSDERAQPPCDPGRQRQWRLCHDRPTPRLVQWSFTYPFCGRVVR